MEGKYRYRTGPVEMTGKPVPKEYWTDRNIDLIGGKGFVTKKNDAGTWVIAVRGEQVEHENPADYYNTVLKMAKKRAHVDAILTATAASDIFTQDVEDMPEVIPGAKKEPEQKPPLQVPGKKPEQTDPSKISEAQRKRFYAIAKGTGYSDEQIKSHLKEAGIEHTADIPKDQYGSLCGWAQGGAPEEREAGSEG
jgi:hypothetical protein